MNFSEIDRRIISKAMLIRQCEQKLLELFKEGEVNGTVHTCVGQEFIGAVLSEEIKSIDTIFSNHRGHGHFIGATDNLEGLIAEVMGKVSGVSSGIGGSQHLFSKNFFSNGIQGGLMPIAAGYAYKKKIEKSDGISVIFIGDGTLGEGILYETLNIISKWELPVLVIIENNHYAQSTSMKSVIAGEIKDRAKAFNIKYNQSNTWDWKAMSNSFSDSFSYVRNKVKPLILEIETYRLNAHSKGDDNRNKSEIEEFNKKDPLNIILNENKKFFAQEENLINKRINDAVSSAQNDKNCDYNIKHQKMESVIKWQKSNYESDVVSKLIYLSLNDQFKSTKKTILIGEDVEGEYGGAFKVTKDLSIKYPGKIQNTPISEAAIIGMGTGLAMNGYSAIVEIMFGDFLSLGFDQIINHASKFCQMFGTKIKIPLIIRTPMGGKRGYGPTHSQSIEKHFLGIPNLDVIALNEIISPRNIYKNIFSNAVNPTLVIENKLLYPKKLKNETILGFDLFISDELYPTVKISPIENKPDITLFCYGGIFSEVEIAVEQVFYDQEILCEVICPTLINPLNHSPIINSVKKTKKLLIIEDGPSVASLGAEVMSFILERSDEPIAAKKIGFDGIIPCSAVAEKKITVNAKEIEKKIIEVFNEK
jgi:2-oxoisovalerate dehydrogenase E1 component